MKPRVVVLGEKPQGATWLKILLESNLFEVVGGVPRHSKKNIWWEAECFEDILRASKIPVLRREELRNIDYQIIWSLMYGFVIEKDLIDKADFGLNLHESPLPKMRGCNGYSHSILENQETYGTTFHMLDSELDKGDLIDQELVRLSHCETSKELYVRTSYVSNLVFRRNLAKVASGEFPRTPIDVSDEPVRPRSSLLELKKIAAVSLENYDVIYRLIRALDFVPFEPCYFESEARKYYLFINGSLGRFDHRGSGVNRANLSFLSGIHSVNPISIVKHSDREVIVMEESVYRSFYPLFLPEYSWIKNES